VLNSKVNVHYDLFNLLGSNRCQDESRVKINRLPYIGGKASTLSYFLIARDCTYSLLLSFMYACVEFGGNGLSS
jgi:hypothetical protein